MKTAVIGSRVLTVKKLGSYLPDGTDEIVSGGAKGIDTCAREYAIENSIKLTEFLPEYEKYGRAAPLRRNEKIVDYSDFVVAFWDGKSKGTRHVLERCKKLGKPHKLFKKRKDSGLEATEKLFENGFSEEEIGEIFMDSLSEILWEIMSEEQKMEYNGDYETFRISNIKEMKEDMKNNQD